MHGNNVPYAPLADATPEGRERTEGSFSASDHTTTTIIVPGESRFLLPDQPPSPRIQVPICPCRCKSFAVLFIALLVVSVALAVVYVFWVSPNLNTRHCTHCIRFEDIVSGRSGGGGHGDGNSDHIPGGGGGRRGGDSTASSSGVNEGQGGHDDDDDDDGDDGEGGGHEGVASSSSSGVSGGQGGGQGGEDGDNGGNGDDGDGDGGGGEDDGNHGEDSQGTPPPGKSDISSQSQKNGINMNSPWLPGASTTGRQWSPIRSGSSGHYPRGGTGSGHSGGWPPYWNGQRVCRPHESPDDPLPKWCDTARTFRTIFLVCGIAIVGSVVLGWCLAMYCSSHRRLSFTLQPGGPVRYTADAPFE